MHIGSNIKRLRREHNVTQDSLAEALGISSRAISQWETGKTAPDLSMIPSLCHFFGVTSDELLSIDIEKNDKEIEQLLKEAVLLASQAKYAERIALLREANKKYPRNYKIMYRLANAILMEQCLQNNEDCSEVIALCRRILDECTDSTIRYETISTLAHAYQKNGMEAERRALINEMPPAEYSKEHFLVYSIRDLSELPDHQEYIIFLLHDLFPSIFTLCGYKKENGEMLYSKEDVKRLKKLVVDLLELLFPDGDFGEFASDGWVSAAFMFHHALDEGDDEAFWYWLEKRADFAIQTDTYHSAPHTSPILRGHRDDQSMLSPEGNCSQTTLHMLLTDEKLTHLHEDPRFKAITDRLAKTARKPGKNLVPESDDLHRISLFSDKQFTL